MPTSVFVLVLDDVFDTGLAAILDIFEAANELGREEEKARPRFVVRVIGMRKRVRTHQGFRVQVEREWEKELPDVVIVPALGAKTPGSLSDALERRDVADTATLLQNWSRSGIPIGAACTGTFILAKSAILDRRVATTSWWLAPMFRERFPHVELDESRMLVEDSGVITAGAALAHIDLAFWFVRRTSPSLARLVAHHLIIDERPSQAPYVIAHHLAHSDPIVERFERWVHHHLAEQLSLAAAARSIRVSERTLERRVHKVLGRSPISYVQDLRVERALHMLQTTDESIDAIASAVGYRNAMTLRNLLRKKTRRGVRELRTVRKDQSHRT